MPRQKNVLVIGGVGYIGSVLVRELLKSGYFVRVLDNLVFGSDSVSDLMIKENFQLIKGDVRHIEDLIAAMKGMDIVIDLAALVGDRMCNLDRKSAIAINYEATKIVLEICKFCNIGRFIFASTCSVYGKTNDSLSTEQSSLNPISIYAETKAMSEEVILNNSITSTIFRIATACGVSFRMRFDLVLNFFVANAIIEGKIKIFGGKQWRPLINVSDVAKAFILCIESKKDIVDHQIFNLGHNEQNLQICQLGEIVKECIPDTKIEYVGNIEDERDYKVSFSRIVDVLGFKPDKNIKKTISEIKELFDNGTIRNYKDIYYYNVDYKY